MRLLNILLVTWALLVFALLGALGVFPAEDNSAVASPSVSIDNAQFWGEVASVLSQKFVDFQRVIQGFQRGAL